VKFVERNILTPIPDFESLETFNGWLKEKCLAYQGHTQARQTDSVRQELNHLLPIPVHPPGMLPDYPGQSRQVLARAI
jgi:hypothetical protein